MLNFIWSYQNDFFYKAFSLKTFKAKWQDDIIHKTIHHSALMSQSTASFQQISPGKPYTKIS